MMLSCDCVPMWPVHTRSPEKGHSTKSRQTRIFHPMSPPQGPIRINVYSFIGSFVGRHLQAPWARRGGGLGVSLAMFQPVWGHVVRPARRLVLVINGQGGPSAHQARSAVCPDSGRDCRIDRLGRFYPHTHCHPKDISKWKTSLSVPPLPPSFVCDCPILGPF